MVRTRCARGPATRLRSVLLWERGAAGLSHGPLPGALPPPPPLKYPAPPGSSSLPFTIAHQQHLLSLSFRSTSDCVISLSSTPYWTVIFVISDLFVVLLSDYYKLIRMNVRQELVSRSYVVHNSDYDEQPISRTYQYRKVMNTFISCNRHCGGLFDRNGLFFILLIDNSLARELALKQ